MNFKEVSRFVAVVVNCPQCNNLLTVLVNKIWFSIERVMFTSCDQRIQSETVLNYHHQLCPHCECKVGDSLLVLDDFLEE